MAARMYEAIVTTIPPTAADRRRKAIITFHVEPTADRKDAVREVLPHSLRRVLDSHLAQAPARVGVPFTISESREAT